MKYIIAILFFIIPISIYSHGHNMLTENDLSNEIEYVINAPIHEDDPEISFTNTPDVDRIRLFSFQTGIWQPVGNLGEIFNTGLLISARIPLIRSNFHFIDGGISYIYPFKSELFDIWTGVDGKGNQCYTSVKGKGIIDLGIWYRYKKQIGNNTFWNRYAGLGLDILLTDGRYSGETGEYDPTYGDFYFYDSDGRETIYAFFINMGMDIRYKAIGLFIELNNAFYNWASGPPQIHGGLSINTGINFKF